MYRLLQGTLGFLFYFLVWCWPSSAQAQFEVHPDSSFYTFLDSFYHYYQDDSTEGGLYNKMRRATMIWGPRLAPDGKMSRANRAMLNYSRAYMNIPFTGGGNGNASTTPIQLPPTHPAPTNWRELGHITPLSGGNPANAKGMGQIQRLAFHPNYNGTTNQIIYAGSHYGGLYRTDNGAGQWYNYHTDRGLPMTSVGDVATSATHVFVCTGNGDHISTHFGIHADYAPIRGSINEFSPIHTQGVYRNTHNNPSSIWTSINGNLVTFLDGSDTTSLLDVFGRGGTMRRIIVHPTNDQLILIATSQGIFRTTNGGIHWEQVLVGSMDSGSITNYRWDTQWRGLEFHPTNPNIVYASGEDIYKSVDGGATWVSMTNEQGLKPSTKRINITVTPAAPDRLYAYVMADRGYIFLYENGNWIEKDDVYNSSADWLDIAVSPVYQDVVYVTGLTMFYNYNFDDSSSSFIAELQGGNFGGGVHDDFHYLGYPPNGDTVLFAGTHGGVSRCVTSATRRWRWKNVYNGLGVSLIYSFDDWLGDDSLLLTANQDIGVNHSYDRGANWLSSYNMGDGYSVRMNQQTAMAYLRGNEYQGVYRLYPHLSPAHNYSATKPVYEKIKYPRDSTWRIDGSVSPQAMVPNTFPAVNHPKDESFQMGFTELYWRKSDTIFDPFSYINIVHDTVTSIVYGDVFDSLGNYIRTPPNSGQCFPGRVDSIFTRIIVPARGIYRVDTLCSTPHTHTVYGDPHPTIWALKSDLKHHHSSHWDRRILEIAFSEDEATNYTYLATLGDVVHRRSDFYVNDANTMGCDTCYVKKTANLPFDNTVIHWVNRDPNPITGIAVDPLDGNRVWATFSGYSKDIKVWYSDDAGDNWISWDDSVGALANLNVPINNIVYQRGTNDRLYIATDVGVYVREGQGAWLRYGEDFPNVRVTELKINYCIGQLRASTFGRGMWEADLLPVEKNIAYRSFRTVDTSETWTADKHLSRDLKIKAGATLYLDSITLNMPKGGLIVIEQGAQLIANGSTLTNLCGQTWQGIEVWGNTSLEQFPNTNQGELILLGSTIEHAKEAVSPWQVGNFPKPDGTGGTGGIVRAVNSTFKNNWRSVGFMQYQSPSGTHAEASRFMNCQFVVDDEMRQDFLGHVSAWDVARLYLEGCHFSDQRTNKTGNPYGILSLSASVHLTAQAPTPSHPNFVRNSFEGLARAIELGSDPTRFSSVIDQSDFDANSRGVIVRADAGVKILRNHFQLGGYSNTPEYGIGLLRQGDFVIQQNTFTQSPKADAFDITIGLWVHDTKSGYNQVRNNSFTGIPLANLVHGDNGASINDPFAGLQYLCNGQTSNAFDLTLFQSQQLSVGTSIAPNQGDVDDPAKNSFSYPLDGNYFADWHLWNDGSGMSKVLYWIPPSALQEQEPTDTLRVENLISNSSGNPNFCDDRYTNPYVFKPQEGGVDITLSTLKSNYYQYYTNYQTLKASASTTADSSQVAAIGQQVAYWANEVVFHYQNDTSLANWDSLAVWLDKVPGLHAQYDLVEHYWKQGLYTQAFNQLDYIQDNYELVGVMYDNHKAYKSLKNIILTAYEDNRNEALLVIEEVDQLRAIANNNYGFAAIYAANIINFFYNDEYQYAPTLPTPLQDKKLEVEKFTVSNLVIYPNPSHTWAQVQYQLPKGQQEGLITITSTNGQILQQIPINQSTGQITLGTKTWLTGTYFVALYSGEELVEQTTLVVKN